ncbi:hypothetical protein [Novosphingobium sp.]|uniref:hypothetical protein n=1 Tax=Novosphingobium sp. TaxID=1874826 RepID=UPI003B524FBF
MPFTPPPGGSPARLPFLLLPLLVAAAGVQLALPGHVDLATGGLPARIGVTLPPEPPLVVLPPAILIAHDPFVPVAVRAPEARPAPPPDPLGGAVIAGVVQEGRRRVGVVQRADGMVRHLAVGDRLAGWRIDALTPGGADLSRGRHRIIALPYGTHPVPSLPPHAAKPTADDQ